MNWGILSGASTIVMGVARAVATSAVGDPIVVAGILWIRVVETDGRQRSLQQARERFFHCCKDKEDVLGQCLTNGGLVSITKLTEGMGLCPCFLAIFINVLRKRIQREKLKEMTRMRM
jgi:hypothetical protein